MNRSPWIALHAQLHQTLRSRQLLPRTSRVLVAVSGGQDSLCLAKLLLDLQPKWDWHLAIAHCDHRWRADSQANADYVARLASSWQLPFYLQTATQSIQTEAEARRWRYEALSAIAIEGNYPYLVTGHTMSDRAETFLYNLMRGSGADGLQALTWKRLLVGSEEAREEDFKGEFSKQSNGKISQQQSEEETPPFNVYLARPLLEVTRSQTEQFCREIGLNVWEDSTNQNLQYRRNRIRLELLPYLKTNFNPQVEQHLAQTAELLRADVEYLEEAASQLLQQALSHNEREVNNELATIQIDRRVLRTAPLAIQRRAMRQLLQQIFPFAPSFAHVEKLTALIDAPNRFQTDPFPGGAIAFVDGEWIAIAIQPS